MAALPFAPSLSTASGTVRILLWPGLMDTGMLRILYMQKLRHTVLCITKRDTIFLENRSCYSLLVHKVYSTIRNPRDVPFYSSWVETSACVTLQAISQW